MQSIIIGYDNGRLYTKAKIEERKVVSINAVSKGYDLRQMENQNELPENQMDFMLYEDGKLLGRFFTGAMAVKNHSGDLIYSTSGIKKFAPDMLLFEKVKMLGSIGLLAYKQGVSNNDQLEAYMGTGLPIEEYFDDNDSNLDGFIKSVIGKRYKLEFMAKEFKGYTIEVKIKEVEKTAEGTSSLLGNRMSLEKGKLVKDPRLDTYLSEGPIMVINIGSSSSDIAVFKEDGTYDSKGFIGLEIGSEWVLDNISRRLKEEYGYMPDKIKLEGLVLSGAKIKYKGKIIELKEIAEEAYRAFLNKFRTMLLETLRAYNVSVSELSAVFYTGGTTGYIESILGDAAIKNIISEVPGLISTDPLFDDAKGYLIVAYAKYLETKRIETAGVTEDSDEDVIEVS